MKNKIAIVLYGQVRSFEVCKHLLKKIIIRDNDVDIFMCIDPDNRTATEDSLRLNTVEETNTIEKTFDYFGELVKGRYIFDEQEYKKSVIELTGQHTESTLPDLAIMDWVIGEIDTGNGESRCIYKNIGKNIKAVIPTNSREQLLRYSKTNNQWEILNEFTSWDLDTVDEKYRVWLEKYVRKYTSVHDNGWLINLKPKDYWPVWCEPMFRQYFLVNEGYKMLKDFVEEQKKDYTHILKMRLDQIIWLDSALIGFDLYDDRKHCRIKPNKHNELITEQADLSMYKNDLPVLDNDTDIYVAGAGVEQKFPYVNDQIWLHHPAKIDTMAGFYSEIPGLISPAPEITPTLCYIEHWFMKFLYRNKFNIYQMPGTTEYIRMR